MMNFDYVFVRDHGIKPLLPNLGQLSDETLMIALSIDWWSVDMSDRLAVKDELRRRHPEWVVDVLPIGERWKDRQKEYDFEEEHRRHAIQPKTRWWWPL